MQEGLTREEFLAFLLVVRRSIQAQNAVVRWIDEYEKRQSATSPPTPIVRRAS